MIESFGSTSLVQVGNNFYFYPVGGSSGPLFKYGGSAGRGRAVCSGAIIGAEKTASGYQVALRIAGADQYTVWNTDSNGNVVSNGTGGVVVSGSSSVLKSLEPSFHQDLNGDGMIGSAAAPSDRDRVVRFNQPGAGGKQFLLLPRRRQQRPAVQIRRLAGRGGAVSRGAISGRSKRRAAIKSHFVSQARTSTRSGTPTAMAMSFPTGRAASSSRVRAPCLNRLSPVSART